MENRIGDKFQIPDRFINKTLILHQIINLTSKLKQLNKIQFNIRIYVVR
jgi:hypothetical protein